MDSLCVAPGYSSTACTCGRITSPKSASYVNTADIRCKDFNSLTCLPIPITRPVPLFCSTPIRIYRHHSTDRRTSELGNPSSSPIHTSTAHSRPLSQASPTAAHWSFRLSPRGTTAPLRALLAARPSAPPQPSPLPLGLPSPLQAPSSTPFQAPASGNAAVAIISYRPAPKTADKHMDKQASM
ncbi:hypothetical protein BC567DRAFT_95925 [Phyllosticta citribraziliensis]